MAETPGHRDGMRRMAGPLVLAAIGVMMLWCSWGTWPDVLVDFGRELYTAWRVAAGTALYAHLGYFQGPLSPYVNALWFTLFGVHFYTLVVCNLLLLSLTYVLLYRLLTSLSSRTAALIACSVFLTVFAFGQLVGCGNYNYVCPYSHDAVHGVLLSLAALSCFHAYQRSENVWWGAGCGIALGLTFLTKAELFLAIGIAMAAGWGLMFWKAPATPPRVVRVVGALMIGMLLPPLIAWTGLSRLMPPMQALRGVLGTWSWVLHDQAASMRFYRWSMGLLDPVGSARDIGLWALWYVGVWACTAFLGLVWKRQFGRVRIVLAGLALIAFMGLIAWLVEPGHIFGIAKPLPLLLLVLGLKKVMEVARAARFQSSPVREAIFQAVWLAWALLLLAKIGLNARIAHYGFVLAMPGMMAAVVALTGWLPESVERRGGKAAWSRAAAIGIVCAGIFLHLQITASWFKEKVYPVGLGHEQFLADERGVVVQQAVRDIAQRLHPEDTLVVIPDGLMINYLTRRANPLPHLQYLPFDVLLVGEDRLLAMLKAHLPDYVAYVERDTSEYGFQYFGRDYGLRMASWIDRTYRPVATFGAKPFYRGGFGIVLLKRIVS